MKTKPTRYIGGVLNGMTHDTDIRAKHIHMTMTGDCDLSKDSPVCWEKSGIYTESHDETGNRLMTWRKKPL